MIRLQISKGNTVGWDVICETTGYRTTICETFAGEVGLTKDCTVCVAGNVEIPSHIELHNIRYREGRYYYAEPLELTATQEKLLDYLSRELRTDHLYFWKEEKKMTNERTKHLVEVMQHYLDGGEIQIKDGDEWKDWKEAYAEPIWTAPACEYRIKKKGKTVWVALEEAGCALYIEKPLTHNYLAVKKVTLVEGEFDD